MSGIDRLRANPYLAYSYATRKGLTNFVPDRTHLKLMYRATLESWPDLSRPKTFNEKLQWLKLHDRNPLYTTLVDKYRVKEWVAKHIGAEHVIKTYDAWERIEDIDISGLPERFVLKTNHDCGGIVICRNRSTFDLDAAKKKLAKHLRKNYFWGGREWPYKNVKPLVFAEEYISPDDGIDLVDYKFFRFSNGKMLTLLITDRFSGAELTKTFFDDKWIPLALTEGGHPVKSDVSEPVYFEVMKQFVNKLGEGFPFVRVDFYEAGGRLLFGEMTFFPNSGLERFDPPEWDELLGSWIDLSGAYGPMGAYDE